jgi:AAA+ ATPase superfamily predicted ATPase
MDHFEFAAHERFLNRAADLERLEAWWADDRDRDALTLYGRRRVGKSWLLREFAHGKPALILVAERRAEGAQLNRFADRLAPHIGVRPDLPDLPSLFSVLYALGREEKLLVVVDEFPYLLPSRSSARVDTLTAVQSVMEERDASNLKLMLCGSHIGQMTSLLSDRSPLRGRLAPLRVDPLRFADAQDFIEAGTARERIERFALTGGATLYLDELGRGRDLRQRVCSSVLDSRGPLFNDPREVLEEELRQPSVYFSLLEELASGARSLADLAAALGKRTNELGPYLEMLREMQLVEQIAPLTAGRAGRDHRYRLGDGFLRFWFRFVFPFQDDLRSGLRPVDHFDGEVKPVLADHVAPVFESLCREWTRKQLGRHASRVGSWWGPALNQLRRTGERSVEEVDVIGMGRSAVTVVGECKWTTGRLTRKALDDLEAFKLPAMRQAKLRLAAPGPLIVLFSRSGFKENLVEHAASRQDVKFVDAEQLVADLVS